MYSDNVKVVDLVKDGLIWMKNNHHNDYEFLMTVDRLVDPDDLDRHCALVAYHSLGIINDDQYLACMVEKMPFMEKDLLYLLNLLDLTPEVVVSCLKKWSLEELEYYGI